MSQRSAGKTVIEMALTRSRSWYPKSSAMCTHDKTIFKGALFSHENCYYLRGAAPQTKIEHVSCAIAKFSTLFLTKKNNKASWSKLSEKLKNDI